MGKYVDPNAGIATMANMTNIYNKVVESFITNYQNFSTLLTTLISKNETDLKEARRHVHSIKGISLNLGSKPLYDISEQFELDILSENIDTINAKLPIFLEIFEAVYKELTLYIDNL